MRIPIGSHEGEGDFPGSPALMIYHQAGKLLVALLCVTACSWERQETVDEAGAAARTGSVGEAGAARTQDVATIPTDRAGTFDLDGTVHTFLVVTCDLTGSGTTGMLLRGTGTGPDGRRLTAEVERLTPGETTHERATVYFGGLMDGDHWTARATGWQDGRWFAGEDGSEPVEGPLIRVSGNELTAQGAYRHESDDSTETGRIHATCPE